MIEVEIKLPIREKRDTVAAILRKLGFTDGPILRETDAYFDTADGKIRKSGQALRIREVRDLQTGTGQTVWTFKGKKTDSVSMTRRELETSIGDTAVGKHILEALGYQVVPPVVVKTRQELNGREPGDCMERADEKFPETAGITACLDLVEGLGEFLELEIILPDDGDRQEALTRIEKVLHKLGYSLEDTVTNSYLSMLQGVTD